MKKFFESIGLWFAILLVVVFLYDKLGGGDSLSYSGTNRILFSDFLQQIDTGNISSVTIYRNRGEATGQLSTGEKFVTNIILYDELLKDLHKSNVRVDISSGESVLGVLGSFIFSLLPFLIMIGVWIFAARKMNIGAGKTMSFGRSKAKAVPPEKNKVTFNDVAGVDEAKEDLKELVDFLSNPGKFQALGGKIPRGCLLVGPPGTGKTLLAKAIAGEAKVPFFTISGSDFVEMFVGVGASRVRDMFDQGKKQAPCLIFIDEIDAVGRHRGIGLGGGNDEREQTLNQLLVEMDGFDSNEGVIIIAATNRPDVLDNALLRPGRFDRQIVVSNPDLLGREQILGIHMKKIKLAPDVNVNVVARGTPGFSGADLANLANEAALIAARKNKNLVTMEDFEYALDKIMMGAERRTLVMQDEERRRTAYHEAGHALVGCSLEASDPIHKATIIPRGRALGVVMRLPEHDRLSMTRAKMLADLAVAMGGRAAEELIFGQEKVTSGAVSDIQQATKLAQAMVMEWGMSETVGMINHNNDDDYLVSDETAKLIDSEIKRYIDEAYDYAIKLLTKKKKQLALLAEELLTRETLTGVEIDQLLKTGKIKEPFVGGKGDKAKAEVPSSSVPRSKTDSKAKTDSKKSTSKSKDEKNKNESKDSKSSSKAEKAKPTKKTGKKE